MPIRYLKDETVLTHGDIWIQFACAALASQSTAAYRHGDPGTDEYRAAEDARIAALRADAMMSELITRQKQRG